MLVCVSSKFNGDSLSQIEPLSPSPASMNMKRGTLTLPAHPHCHKSSSSSLLHVNGNNNNYSGNGGGGGGGGHVPLSAGHTPTTTHAPTDDGGLESDPMLASGMFMGKKRSNQADRGKKRSILLWKRRNSLYGPGLFTAVVISFHYKY